MKWTINTSFKRNFIAVLAGLALFSCDKEPTQRDPLFNPLLAAELRQSPSEVTLAGNVLQLEVYVWRDFMPVVGPDGGSSLMSMNRLTDANNAVINGEIVLERQHVISGELVWTATYDDVTTLDSLSIQGISRNGPLWEPGIFVDVVCEFSWMGGRYFVIAQNQEINATY